MGGELDIGCFSVLAQLTKRLIKADIFFRFYDGVQTFQDKGVQANLQPLGDFIAGLVELERHAVFHPPFWRRGIGH
jgi:hypothetical protein